jgi:hypothetical protein
MGEEMRPLAHGAIRWVILSSVTIGLAAAAHAEQPALVHSRLDRIAPRALAGHTLATHMETYTLGEDGDVAFGGIMGARGEGTWTVEGRGLRLAGQGRGGPCGDEAACEQPWPWELHITAAFRSTSGLLVLHLSPPRERLVFQCDAKRHCQILEDAPVVGVLAASEDRTLHRATLQRLASRDFIVVEGAPARNPRDISEIWWLPPHNEARAERVGRALAVVIGYVDRQEWTFGPSAYDVIVVVGTYPLEGGIDPEDE